ncbi:hypothetical protein [Corynebacterium matruchotii]|uniref:hypothetical protein n=1 Tax=Corynebacterium matruchotii TaxID=43768 RepID=UPI0028EE738D|nr:hypothetical protein [Corynebacterium matruchotii]
MPDYAQMPVKTKAVVFTRELHNAIRAVVKVASRKSADFDVVKLVFRGERLLVCAANPRHMIQAVVSTYFAVVAAEHAEVEITAASARLLLKLKPDFKKAPEAQCALFVSENELTLQDLSGTCGDLTDVTAARLAPTLPTDVVAVMDRVRDEVRQGVDAASPVVLTAAQMDAISAAIQYAQVPFCAPIGLPPGDYLARCYAPLGGMVESYSTVTDVRRPHAADGGPARDADGFEYVATLPVALRQITARPNLSGGAV